MGRCGRAWRRLLLGAQNGLGDVGSGNCTFLYARTVRDGERVGIGDEATDAVYLSDVPREFSGRGVVGGGFRLCWRLKVSMDPECAMISPCKREILAQWSMAGTGAGLEQRRSICSRNIVHFCRLAAVFKSNLHGVWVRSGSAAVQGLGLWRCPGFSTGLILLLCVNGGGL